MVEGSRIQQRVLELVGAYERRRRRRRYAAALLAAALVVVAAWQFGVTRAPRPLERTADERLAAVRTLRADADETAAQALAPFAYDDDPRVAFAAADALAARLAVSGAWPSVSAAAPAAFSGDLPPILQTAFDAFRAAPDREALKRLLMRAASAPEPVARRFAAFAALGLREADEGVRMYAWQALARGLPQDVDSDEIDLALASMLESGAPVDRREAARIAGSRRREGLVPSVETLLASDDRELQESGVFALQRIGNDAAKSALRAAVGRGPGHLATSAGCALFALGDRAAASALIARFDSGAREERANILQALLDARDARAVPLATRALQPDGYVRVLNAACEILGAFGEPVPESAVPWLSKHESPTLRTAFAYARAASNADPEATALRAMLGDRNVSVRLFAAQLLLQLDPDRFRSDVATLLKDADAHVRDVIAHRLGVLPPP